ncbi:hypothetical protein [Actinoplanes regularis]|uniref:DUF91 domain-containing protein n=1 Tax=Actinoplanes regularis TaxID=52697 RepID=A0A239IUP4_9ACTN|nr:hypothetical protein [Actinoplanes regularis]GIE91575.1 hypothetical protein Are01nite_80550 [Actinoplanes regularis]SNS97245.1 hypothetical protein SAMN06264365_13116 [Actinoplanes regularis]
MTAIYSEGPDGWQLITPQGFPNERTLQELVAQAPDLLPLSGNPRVVVLGREVLIGSGYVDVIAIEATGEPVLIEVKLHNNAESRRAVVAQILSYAAGLHGMTVDEFEGKVLAKCLAGRSLVDRIRDAAQAEALDADELRQNVHDTLQTGGFRLVLVLDQAPPDLVRLVGYLEAVSTQDLVIDLITVSSYDINGQRVVVPQRVQPETPPPVEYSRPEAGGSPRSQAGGFAYGVEPFRERVTTAPAEHQSSLQKLLAWAKRIEEANLAEIGTYFGKRGEAVLLPRLLPESAGLASLYCWPDGRPAIQLWRSVFERRAPHSIAAVTDAAGTDIGQGNMVQAVSDGLLDALFRAYQEASETPK